MGEQPDQNQPKVLKIELLGIGLLFLYLGSIVDIRFSSWTCLAIILVVDKRVCHMKSNIFIFESVYWVSSVSQSDIMWSCPHHQTSGWFWRPKLKNIESYLTIYIVDKVTIFGNMIKTKIFIPIK